jgi:hypothetical protein
LTPSKSGFSTSPPGPVQSTGVTNSKSAPSHQISDIRQKSSPIPTTRPSYAVLADAKISNKPPPDAVSKSASAPTNLVGAAISAEARTNIPTTDAISKTPAAKAPTVVSTELGTHPPTTETGLFTEKSAAASTSKSIADNSSTTPVCLKPDESLKSDKARETSPQHHPQTASSPNKSAVNGKRKGRSKIPTASTTPKMSENNVADGPATTFRKNDNVWVTLMPNQQPHLATIHSVSIDDQGRETYVVCYANLAKDVVSTSQLARADESHGRGKRRRASRHLYNST